ncbi:MAG: chemotaxis protein CheW [Planctomycetaceae bacterium]
MPSPHGSTPHPGASRFAGQYVRFELAGQHYACRIERIREIVIPDRVTTIPEVPTYVQGVSNLRGAIIPVVDLRILLGLHAKERDADTRTMVVNVGSRVMGCTVDAVSQVVRIPEDDVRPPPDSAALGGPRFIEGFARLGDDLLILLDSDQLLSPENLEQVHRASQVHHDTAGDP